MNLSKEQVERLQGLLDDRQAELLTMVQEHVGQLRDDSYPEQAGVVGDQADQALTDLMRDTDNAAVTRDVREMRDIERARARIASGDYGTCVDCGVDIGYERLEVNPTAIRCVPCQSLYEHTHAVPNEPSL